MYILPQSVLLRTPLFGGIHIRRGRSLFILMGWGLQEPQIGE